MLPRAGCLTGAHPALHSEAPVSPTLRRTLGALALVCLLAPVACASDGATATAAAAHQEPSATVALEEAPATAAVAPEETPATPSVAREEAAANATAPPQTPEPVDPQAPVALPEAAETASAPEASVTHEAPEASASPETPEASVTPETPETPEASVRPETPEAPEASVADETPEAEASPAAGSETAAAGDDWLFDDDFDEELDWDPLEPINRVSFGGNELFRKIFFDPLARGYGFLTPAPVRRSVRRFFNNLSTPSVLINDLLQLKLRDAGTTGARFLINTTVGIVGLFDPAKSWGLTPRHADFGETLAVYGAGEGPYLVMPFFGPANARDGLGRIVDMALRPDIWLLSAGTVVLLLTGDGFTAYAVDRVRLEELRKSSVDFYAALRSAYLMERRAQISEARSEPRFFSRRPEPALQAVEGDLEPPDDASAATLESLDEEVPEEPVEEAVSPEPGIAEEPESGPQARSSTATQLP